MAIQWSDDDRQRVAVLLERYPVESGRCEDLARRLLPIASGCDANSKMWRIEPAEGRYVVPKVKLDALWFFHVTTECAAHYVDALTGIHGTAWAEYLPMHWTETDALVWIEEQP
jgi:hypothetical protein